MGKHWLTAAAAAAVLAAATSLAAVETPQLLQALKAGDRAAALTLAADRAQATATEANGTTPLRTGSTVLIPYGAGPTSVHGPVRAVRCLPPD